MAATILQRVFVIVSVCLYHTTGDYQCACNFDEELEVMSSPSGQGTPLGYMYEFDCKGNLKSLNSDQWLAVAFEHKIGYIPRGPQTQQQLCVGEVSPEDRVTTTTVTMPPTSTATTPLTTTMSRVSTTQLTEPITTSTVTTLSTTKSTTYMPTITTTARGSTNGTDIIHGKPELCAASIRNHTHQSGSLLTQYGDMCYETVTTTLMTWFMAERYCNTNGGHLVTINDVNEQAFIYNYLSQNYRQAIWIGLSDSQMEGKFEWTSGTNYVYKHWYQEDFNFVSDFEDCALLTINHNGEWDDRECADTHRFMCEYRLDGVSLVTPPPTYVTLSNITAPGDISRCPSSVVSQAKRDGAHLGYYQDSCYEFIPGSVNHAHARSVCQSRNGQLVDILNVDEQHYIETFLQLYSQQHAVWIGLHDRYTENSFEWTSGASMNYTNWVPNHVNNVASHEQEDCVLILPFQYGQWDDVPCGGEGVLGDATGELHPYVCEYKLSKYGGNALVG